MILTALNLMVEIGAELASVLGLIRASTYAFRPPQEIRVGAAMIPICWQTAERFRKQPLIIPVNVLHREQRAIS